jgi:hypothetical protein
VSECLVDQRQNSFLLSLWQLSNARLASRDRHRILRQRFPFLNAHKDYFFRLCVCSPTFFVCLCSRTRQSEGHAEGREGAAAATEARQRHRRRPELVRTSRFVVSILCLIERRLHANNIIHRDLKLANLVTNRSRMYAAFLTIHFSWCRMTWW